MKNLGRVIFLSIFPFFLASVTHAADTDRSSNKDAKNKKIRLTQNQLLSMSLENNPAEGSGAKKRLSSARATESNTASKIDGGFGWEASFRCFGRDGEGFISGNECLPDKPHYCGGTHIGDGLVLTATSCVPSPDPGIKVRLFDNNKKAKDFQIEQVFHHPEAYRENLQISVVKLKGNRFNNFPSTKVFNGEIKDSDRLVLSGWGRVPAFGREEAIRLSPRKAILKKEPNVKTASVTGAYRANSGGNQFGVGAYGDWNGAKDRGFDYVDQCPEGGQCFEQILAFYSHHFAAKIDPTKAVDIDDYTLCYGDYGTALTKNEEVVGVLLFHNFCGNQYYRNNNSDPYYPAAFTYTNKQYITEFIQSVRDVVINKPKVAATVEMVKPWANNGLTEYVVKMKLTNHKSDQKVGFTIEPIWISDESGIEAFPAYFREFLCSGSPCMPAESAGDVELTKVFYMKENNEIPIDKSVYDDYLNYRKQVTLNNVPEGETVINIRLVKNKSKEYSIEGSCSTKNGLFGWSYLGWDGCSTKQQALSVYPFVKNNTKGGKSYVIKGLKHTIAAFGKKGNGAP